MAKNFFYLSLQEWALCLITALWGGTFLLIRFAMQETGTFCYVFLRFGTAALVMLICTLPILKDLTRRELLGGLLMGVINFSGFSLQTAGLITVEAARSAFISACYVPLVPLFELILMRHKLTGRMLLGIILAFLGIALLSGVKNIVGGLGSGEFLTLLCAVCFALEIVVTGMVVPGTNPRRIVSIELLVVTLLAFVAMPVVHENFVGLSPFVLWSACGLGFVTAMIQSIIAWAQKSVSPTRASIIYAGEPVWGGIFGYLAGERFSVSVLAGGICVLAGILTSSLKKKENN